MKNYSLSAVTIGSCNYVQMTDGNIRYICHNVPTFDPVVIGDVMAKARQEPPISIDGKSYYVLHQRYFSRKNPTDLSGILSKEREIWEDLKMTLPEIVSCLGVTYGDICRCARNIATWERTHKEPDADEAQNRYQLQKELGNLLTSCIRYIDDLGFDAEKCIGHAFKYQEKFLK